LKPVVVRFLAILLLAGLLHHSPAIAADDAVVVTTRDGPVQFSVEVAVTPQERAVGLMHRRELSADNGMIFDFGAEQDVLMWMRNTYLPLDMLFIDAGGTIRHIARRTTPLSERTISSQVPVRYVLEINGGLADKLKIAVGDTVSGAGLALP
jgi:uncharacterized membrane protein (UPF0127 family)